MLSDRKKEILKAVVDDYIMTAEPVGSKAVSRRLSVPVSSATVRNEMADLENMGYLEQPHTSAGRVPSNKGYRLYVDELMERYRLNISEIDRIEKALSIRVNELDKLIIEAGRMVSELTNHPTITVTPSRSEEKIRRFEVIKVDEHTIVLVLVTTSDMIKNRICHLTSPLTDFDAAAASKALNDNFTGISLEGLTQEQITAAEFATGQTITEILIAAIDFAEEVISASGRRQIYLEGAPNILRFPEYRDIDRAYELMDFLSDTNAVGELTALSESEIEIKITIGEENLEPVLTDSSIIMTSYGSGGLIGVLGPTRMDYARVSARLRRFAEGLERYFK
ncbi:MAG: heat-inducible transcription repressor HrcA [Clostridiales bacterium]|jgi:heat-inducible transcriptional repressor|nr:heat-inducible transcription repressor HrcA [Clostridiales bacterium]